MDGMDRDLILFHDPDQVQLHEVPMESLEPLSASTPATQRSPPDTTAYPSTQDRPSQQHPTRFVTRPLILISANFTHQNFRLNPN